MEPQDKPPAPGAVPQLVAPQQVTAPIPLGQPWAYPHYPQPAPTVDLKKQASQGIELAFKLIQVAVLLSGIVFAAGIAREKLAHIEENQKAADTARIEQNRMQSERDDKFSRALERLGRKVDELAEQGRQDHASHRPRRRDSDRPMQPGP